MKTRAGFVSNSSSSSFIIGKGCMSVDQLYKIKNHKKEAPEYNMDCEQSDEWDIKETKDYVIVYTEMDNFDMYRFLRKIGIPEEDIDQCPLCVW